MEILVTLDENKSQGLSPQAKDELTSSVNQYTEAIVYEAQRIESGQNPNNQQPDINRLMIQQAVIYLRRIPRKRKVEWYYIASAVIAPITGIFIGFLYKPKEFTDIGKLWVFIGVVMLFAVTTFISAVGTYNGGQNE
jgi:hypothetical protein